MKKEKVLVQVMDGEYAGRKGYYYKGSAIRTKTGTCVMWYSEEGKSPYRSAVLLKNLQPIKS